MDLAVTMRENVRSDWRKYSIHLYGFSNRRDARDMSLLVHVYVCMDKTRRYMLWMEMVIMKGMKKKNRFNSN